MWKLSPKPKKFFEELFGGMDKEREVRVSLNDLAIPQDLSRAVQQWRTWTQLLQREPVGLMMPYDLLVE